MTLKSFKIVCIIMIIAGVLGIASNISSLAGSGASIFITILAFLFSIGMLVAGFIGNKAAKDGDEDKAPLCRKLSYALLALAVVNFVIGLIPALNVTAPGLPSSLIPTMAIVIGIVSLILPVLYFLGAKKLGE